MLNLIYFAGAPVHDGCDGEVERSLSQKDAMLMLAPSSVGRIGTSVVLSDGGSFGSTLAARLGERGDATAASCQVRSSPVLESWKGLKEVSM